MRIVLCIILIFSATQPSYCQQQILNGTIKENSTGKALAYASVYIKNTQQATISNDNGSFLLPCHINDHDTICISLLGYFTKEIGLKDFTNNPFIFLDPKSNELPEINIKGLNAREVVMKAINNLQHYYPLKEILTESFYRQYHKENNKFVRLIDAVVVSKEEPFNSRNYSKADESLFVKITRRSNSYERNKEKHGDHLIDLLIENPVKHPVGTVLNAKGIMYYNFQFTLESDADDLVIAFNSFNNGLPKAEKGKIYIDESTYLINRIVIESFPNRKAKSVHYIKAEFPFLWQFRNGYYEIVFQKRNGYMQAVNVKKSYTHFLIDNKTNSLAYILEEVFELHPIKTQPDTISDKNFTNNSGLYNAKYDYNMEQWDGLLYLPEKIKEDLEWEEPLEMQFKKNGE